MSNYTNLKNAIQSVIKANGNNEITGPILQAELLSMITTLGAGYQYMGVAQPSTNPGTPDARVMYLAYFPGTYVNFGGLTVTGFCVLKYDTVWTKEDIPISGGGGADFLTEPDDLTLETVGNTNILKFANRSYNSENPNGMGYKILRNDMTLAEQVTGANTIYEIRYDFDLDGITLNIPNNCILLFNGGSISNGTIVFNKTKIRADLVQIFGLNVIFSGTVDILQWECAWFGAKNDGVINTISGSGASFSGTDNFDSIQCTIYNALLTNVHKIHLHQGNFRTSKPIFLGYTEYNNCNFFGDGFTLVKEGGNAATKGTAILFDTNIGGIFVNSSRGTVISDIGLYGKNVDYMVNNGVLNISPDESDWYYTTIEKHNGLECAGISIDALMGNTDFVAFSNDYGIDVTISNIKYSSYVEIKNCTIMGFVSGVDLQVTALTSGSGDYLQLNRVDIGYCVHGFRNFGNQSRKLDINYCRFTDLHTAIENYDSVHSRVGNIQGDFRLCEFGFLYQIFNVRQSGPTFTSCGGENIYMFGEYTNSGNVAPIRFFDGTFNFRQNASNAKLGIIPLVKSTVALYEWAIFYNCTVTAGNDVGYNLFLPNIISYGMGNSLPYNRCVFLQLMVNGYQSMPEFIIQRTPTGNTGKDITISYSSALLNVGDYLCDIATNGLFEIKDISGGVITLTALTYVKGTSLDTTQFDITRNINWYKINKPASQLTSANGMAIERSTLPSDSGLFTKGMWRYSVPYQKPAWWNGERWVDAKGFVINRTFGTTNLRPTLTANDKGYQYYDTTLNKPIWWNGSSWIDATGTQV